MRLAAAIAAILMAACAPIGPAPGVPGTQLSGTSWRVTQVNGRPTPATGDYSMSFDAGRIGARFGCNSMGGRYRQASGVLMVSDLTQTLMGCPEPASTLEREGAAVLGQPARIAFASDERMFLSNGAGSTVLEPFP
ncbi:MAG: META domain-containing protein [Sphingomicrobium sp.]